MHEYADGYKNFIDDDEMMVMAIKIL